MKKIDGFDDCIVGYTDSWNGADRSPRLVYSGVALITRLMQDGMTEEDAFDYYDVNIADAYVGNDTPIIIWPAIPGDEFLEQ
jgi:hypothetical protein